MNVQKTGVTQKLAGGFLNIDKPAGWTSHDVVAKIRSLMRIKRVGHLGTLDPQATGVLPICFGRGTKLATYLSDADKSYDTVLRLGEETETEDATGKVTRSMSIPRTLEGDSGEQKIRDVLTSFVGRYMQLPPMYSAVKINGVPLYKVARRGEVVTRKPRPVYIRAITFLGIHDRDVAFEVTCSKGTYIRTLCVDIGRKLGVGGHLLSLRRTRAGNFNIDEAIELDAFAEQCQTDGWENSVFSLNTALDMFPALWVKASSVRGVLNGVQIGFDGLEKWDVFDKDTPLRFLDPEENLIAIGRSLEDSIVGDRTSNREAAPFRIKTVLGY